MLEANFWKSNPKGIANYYLAALPKKEELGEDQEERGIWLRFVMKHGKDIDKIKENLDTNVLAELMSDCMLAGAFMYKKNKEAFFIREHYKEDQNQKPSNTHNNPRLPSPWKSRLDIRSKNAAYNPAWFVDPRPRRSS